MLTVFEKDHRAEGERRHTDMTTLVASMVQRGSKFRREATRKTRAIVAEIYSAPRVTEAATRHARLGVRWDFNLRERREKAERLIDEQRPLLLIESPRCSAFGKLRNINQTRRDPKVARAELESARVHLR